MKRHKGNGGSYFAAFGLGVFLAIVFPTKFMLVVAAIALVLAGISLVRC